MRQLLKEKPLISVIVPVYNGQDYLKKCIDSIERQTYDNLEVIIVNDGSTDGTGEICRQLQEEYENIRVILTNDEGVSAARNAGLERMMGEFVTFVDADDRIFPDMISTLYSCITETDSDIAGCGFLTWSKEEEMKNLTHAGEGNIGKTYTPAEFLTEGILKGNSRCWSKLYRCATIGELRFRQDITIGEDMLFLVDLMPGVCRVAEIPYKGYGYFQNPTGTMNRDFRPKYMDQITCWELAREEIGRMNIPGMDEARQGKEQLKSRVTAILIMAIMLTAGKLARLSARERKRQRNYIEICHDKIKVEMQVPGAVKALSKGYRVKSEIFAALPEVYLGLYHIWKDKG